MILTGLINGIIMGGILSLPVLGVAVVYGITGIPNFAIGLIGVFGGFLIGVYKLGFNPSVYLDNSWEALELIGVVSGLTKAAAFGFLIALMGCYHGYNSRGGAQGVGAATTNSVVSASILILCFNYVITELFVAA